MSMIKNNVIFISSTFSQFITSKNRSEWSSSISCTFKVLLNYKTLNGREKNAVTVYNEVTVINSTFTLIIISI